MSVGLFRLFCILICSSLLTICRADKMESSTDENVPQRLKVRLFYETLCPDSIYFIRYQLYPAAVEKHLLQYIDLQFVPFGKASIWVTRSTNETQIFCQHGSVECEKNALHACIVENNTLVPDQLALIHCLMHDYGKDIDECGRSLSIDVTAAKECKTSRSTVDILKKYGEKTQALEISFVPSTEFDDVFDPWHQRQILYNFRGVFCRIYNKKFNIELEGC